MKLLNQPHLKLTHFHRQIFQQNFQVFFFSSVSQNSPDMQIHVSMSGLLVEIQDDGDPVCSRCTSEVLKSGDISHRAETGFPVSDELSTEDDD